MSRCEIYAFDQKGDAQYYGDAQNAWGGAMAIWMEMSKAYGLTYSMMSETCPLWERFNSGRIGYRLDKRDDIVLGFTFDRVWVRKENIGKLIDALQSFYDERISTKDIVPTIVGIVEVLRKAAGDEGIQGVAFNQTSVSDAFWHLYPPSPHEDCGDEDCDPCYLADNGRPYNLNTDEGHWELFEALAKPKEMNGG